MKHKKYFYQDLSAKKKKIFTGRDPSWRPDIIQDADLIEELIRIKGFKNIKLIEPAKKGKRAEL